MDIRREPLRTSNKPDARRRVARRVARRQDDTPTKESQLQASDDEQDEVEELPPVTADEDEDNDTIRRLSDDDDNDDDDNDDDEPGTSAKRAKRPDGQPRRVKSERPPASLPATKVFERDRDGSVQLDYLREALPPFRTIGASSL